MTAFRCEIPDGPFDLSFPSAVAGDARVRWHSGGRSTLREPDSTHYVAVGSGTLALHGSFGDYTLREGQFACVPGNAAIQGDGAALISTRLAWLGMPMIGGPIEERGRLGYIDGCSSTVLIAPLRVGDPTMNLLYVPPGTDQTAHTHPSLRAGLVYSGNGVCRVAEGDFPLEPGVAFCIPANKLHSFHAPDDSLRLVVFHPDSDTGPTDEEHPMMNRTLVGGVAANRLHEIHTGRVDE